MMQVVDPSSGVRGREYAEATPEQVRNAIAAADAAFREWRRTSFATRSAAMRKAGSLLRDGAGEYAALMAREMGKPVRDGSAEAVKCAGCCEYYAEHAERFLAREMVATEASRSFVTFQPLGVVLAIMPWNFPFWQVIRFAAPALMAGNGAVLKHAANVPGCALALEDLFRRAGFPENLFRTLLIGTDQVPAVIEHPLVRAVTLTGSEGAGRAVAAKAGAMLKKTVLELGGSDPYLVLADADLDAAANTSAKGRLVNNGQSCIAAKRFIVVESVRAEFEKRFVARMAAAKMGDPMDPATELGPMARFDLRDQLHRQVTESIARGAKCLLGGTIPAGPGAFYPATVLTNVARGMPAYSEEIFGPVAAIIPARDESHAIEIANDSEFGLGAAILTRDTARGEMIAEQFIESGTVFVNDAVRSDARLPFGGIKASGYGRELGSFGIREFVNIKTIVVA
jgi:succinate-semialdehyde dehydrogenase/glutarate-semialdehyde dehydrogenase